MKYKTNKRSNGKEKEKQKSKTKMTSQESLMFDCDGEYAEALEYESEGLEYESEGLEYDSDCKRERDIDDEYDEKEYEEDD